jgi:PAS domain S-box-containing protein
MMDVTERRQADQAWRESEERHRAVWESAADAIALSDPDGTVLAANPAYYDLMDRLPEEVVGQSFAQIFPPAQREQAAEQYRSVFTSAEHVPLFETTIQRADGSEVPVEARYGFVVQDGRRTAMVSMIRDISERRALERLQRELLTVIGHELRNPLSSLRGYAQLMKRRQAYSERAVDIIVQQTDRLDRLIRDLTDMSRIEAGSLTVEPMSMDLVDVVYACAEQARGQDDGHEIRVDAPDAPIIGVWDRGRLEEVVSNLLSNALKYSPDGGEVTVRVEQCDGTARVAVHDHGVGIPPSQLPQVFDRFYRIRETASTASGLGLGLSICKSLIEAHGGRIWAESDGAGHGSSFHFTLPLAPADDSPANSVASPRHPPPAQ